MTEGRHDRHHDEPDPSGTGDGAGTDRGLTPVLGLVLLVGIVAIASVGILVTGGSVTEDSQQRAETERVSIAFRELDQRIESVGRGEGDTETMDFALPAESGGAVRESDTGRLVVERENLTVGTTETLVNRSLGAIVYDDNGRTFAYQAGAVWRKTDGAAELLSAPPFSYATTPQGTEPTLTLPLMVTSGDRRLASGRLRLSANGTISPLNDVTVVQGDLIVVEVTSDYYRGWARYFNQTVNSLGVSVDHANRTVRVEMIVPARAPPVGGGVILGAAQETLKLKQDSVVDSYNSSLGDYASTSTNQTQVLASGDVDLKQNASIQGDLEVGGDLSFDQDALVDGNVSHSTSTTLDFHDTPSTHVDGWIAPNASVGNRSSVDGVIDQNIALIRDHADNGAAANISGDSLADCSSLPGSTCILRSGAYLLDEIHLDAGEHLVLDTTGGPVNIVVLDQIDLRDAGIHVVGNGRVNIYLDGETGSEDFVMKGLSRVSVPDDRAPNLWLYMDSDGEAKLRGRANFTGVIYGPGPTGGTGTEIDMSSTDQINVFGAVVGDIEPITQEVQVHYDAALATATPIQTATAIPRLTFLQVSVHRVDVEQD